MKRADAPTALDLERLYQWLPQCSARNRTIVELGLQTGLRLSEMLSLQVGDVWLDGAPRLILIVSRRKLKGGRSSRARSVPSRTIPLNARARAALMDYLGTDFPGTDRCKAPLFPSQKGKGARAITRQQAGGIIRKVFIEAGLSPHRVWAGHSLRRHFVKAVYLLTKDICLTRAAISHRWISTTQAYLGLDEEDAQAAIMRIGEPVQAHGSELQVEQVQPGQIRISQI